MKLHRLKALLYQEYVMSFRNLETIMDVFIYPVMNIAVFGFITKYLLGSSNDGMFVSLVIGMLFWQIFSVAEYTVSVSTLWNMWSHNLTNLFASPISLVEYFTAHAAVAFIKSVVVFSIGTTIMYLQFGFSLASLPIPLLLICFINLYIVGISFGLVLISLIFAFGTRIQALTWGLVSVIQPLSAVFYPLHIMPSFLQTVARCIPLTYIFEALRGAILNKNITQNVLLDLMFGSLVTFFYCIISIILFHHFLTHSKESGQFAKNSQ